MGVEPHPSLTPFSASLWLFCLVWGFCFLKKKWEKEGVFKFFFTTIEGSFFPFFPRWSIGWGWGCHDADGLYFDYGALVVMGDRRRGVATLCMCLYKSGTQTPKSLVIPWPKLIRTITDDGRAFPRGDLGWNAPKKKKKKLQQLFFFLPPKAFGFTIIL